MNECRNVLVADDASKARELAAELLAATACDAVSRHGQFTLALSGGTSPAPLYQLLASPANAENIPWADTQIFFGDERDVPPEHANSNYRMAEKTLLSAVPILLENLHPMLADATDIDVAAAQYSEQIRRIVPPGPGGLPAFDLILLGMGGDGHTASLFPGSAAITETDRIITSLYVPVLGRSRMTFTLPLINAAHSVLFLITGKDKADAVAAVLGDDPAAAAELPAGRVAPTDGKLIFVLDADAARLTPHRV